MSYFGLIGMNGPSSYGNYGNPAMSSPAGGASETKPGTDYALPGSPENKTGAEAQKIKKSGMSGFFQGMKNGLINTVKGLLSIKGFLITAATTGLVVATGGAALLPLTLMGVGLGGYQIAKGVVKGDTEQMGEGAFTLGASLVGAKISPTTLGGNTLADTSLLGRLKAPFGGKGTFSNSDATFFGASKEATSKTFSSIKDNFQGWKAGIGKTAETGLKLATGSVPHQDSIVQEGNISNARDTVAPPRATFSNAPDKPDSYFQRISNWAGRLWNNPGVKKTRDYFVPNPEGSTNPQSPTNPSAAPKVSYTQRVQTYLQEAKKSLHVISNWIGTIFGGYATPAKKQTSAFTEGRTIYY